MDIDEIKAAAQQGVGVFWFSWCCALGIGLGGGFGWWLWQAVFR
jgi:hypothetical protein